MGIVISIFGGPATVIASFITPLLVGSIDDEESADW
jgi:hypothetical protein